MDFQYKNLRERLEHVEVTDSEIDRQLERAAITTISGFGKISDEAAKLLVI